MRTQNETMKKIMMESENKRVNVFITSSENEMEAKLLRRKESINDPSIHPSWVIYKIASKFGLSVQFMGWLTRRKKQI